MIQAITLGTIFEILTQFIQNLVFHEKQSSQNNE